MVTTSTLQLAERMHEAHRVISKLFGDTTSARLQPIIASMRKASQATNQNEVATMLAYLKARPGLAPELVLLVLAATAEWIKNP